MWSSAINRATGWLLRLDQRMVWRMPQAEPGANIYLTFDDGPTPGTTSWVLDTLSAHGIKATFFCVGRNILNEPALFQRIRAEGHAIGNHTWEHADGWGTPSWAYYRSLLKCRELTGSRLFRPPYGRITNRQLHTVSRHFQVIMWDVLAYDFDDRWTTGQRTERVVDQVRPGSILVFHDSVKCDERMRASLPTIVERLLDKGYTFRPLPTLA